MLTSLRATLRQGSAHRHRQLLTAAFLIHRRDLSIPANQIETGYSSHMKSGGEGTLKTLLVVDMTPGHAVFLDPDLQFIQWHPCGGIKRYRENLKTLGTELVISSTQVGQLPTTGSSPGSPVADQNRLAAVLLQGDLCPIQIGCLER